MNTTTKPTVNLTAVDLQTYELALLSAIEKAEDDGYITDAVIFAKALRRLKPVLKEARG